MKYKVKVSLEIEYEIPEGKSETREDAIETAKGYLLEKINTKQVSYSELKGKII